VVYRGHRKCLFSLLLMYYVELDVDYMAEIAWSWAGPLIFDTLIFALTIHKTWKIGQQCRQRLVRILVRDGACLRRQAYLCLG
jgi:hypothetical protein